MDKVRFITVVAKVTKFVTLFIAVTVGIVVIASVIEQLLSSTAAAAALIHYDGEYLGVPETTPSYVIFSRWVIAVWDIFFPLYLALSAFSILSSFFVSVIPWKNNPLDSSQKIQVRKGLVWGVSGVAVAFVSYLLISVVFGPAAQWVAI